MNGGHLGGKQPNWLEASTTRTQSLIKKYKGTVKADLFAKLETMHEATAVATFLIKKKGH